jgi:hypothetical protein
VDSFIHRLCIIRIFLLCQLVHAEGGWWHYMWKWSNDGHVYRLWGMRSPSSLSSSYSMLNISSPVYPLMLIWYKGLWSLLSCTYFVRCGMLNRSSLLYPLMLIWYKGLWSLLSCTYFVRCGMLNRSSPVYPLMLIWYKGLWSLLSCTYFVRCGCKYELGFILPCIDC